MHFTSFSLSVDEALLREIGNCFADHIVGELLPLFKCQTLLALEMAVSECDSKLVTHQVAQLQIVVAIFKVAHASVEQHLVEALHALSRLTLDTNPLDGTRPPVFGACKTEALGTTIQLAT